jgi:hypothetical protein
MPRSCMLWKASHCYHESSKKFNCRRGKQNELGTILLTEALNEDNVLFYNIISILI